MALQFELDTLNGLEKSVSSLYVPKDGKFMLDVTGLKEPKATGIPKAQHDAELAKLKEVNDSMAEIAQGFIDDIPEEMREIVPELPPAQKIKWIQNATKKGLFAPKTPESGPDSKRPGGKTPKSFEGMNPRQIMATGYKK